MGMVQNEDIPYTNNYDKKEITVQITRQINSDYKKQICLFIYREKMH